jgi:hypothetical protein
MDAAERGRQALQKSLIIAAGFAVTLGGTVPTSLATESQGVRIPDPGIEHVFHCEDSIGWKSEDRRTFTVTEGGRLRIDVRTDEQAMWAEKQAADFGIWIYDRADWENGSGVWHSEYEIENLDAIRHLVPGARAEGHVDYSRGTTWDRYAISVEVLPPSLIDHATLGETEVIRIENRRWKWKDKSRRWNWGEKKWVGEFEPKDVASQVTYVDAQTGMIVRYKLTNSSARTTVCERLGPN